VNRLVHDGMRAAETEKLNACKRAQEEIAEMIIWH
jgi:hypothetical protein